MCDGTALLGIQSAGTAYSTVGSFYAAKEQKSALNAQAGLDDINAHLSEVSAQQALIAGQKNEQTSRLKTAALKGKQTAQLAANGVAITEGSAKNILTSTDVIGEIDANNIAADAVSDAWGYRVQGTNYSNAALMKRASASAISPLASAAGSLISGASSIAQNKYLMDKYGAPAPTKATTGPTLGTR